MTRSTYAEIEQRITDESAKTESEYSMSDLLSYSDFDEIKDDDSTTNDITTLEHNNWVLDGTATLIPGDPTTLNFGVWSNSLSNENTGEFETDPKLEVTFANVHTSTGITFAFTGDSYPKKVTITWYYGVTQLAQQIFTIDAMSYFADLTVENFNKVTMEFSGTSIPCRRIKIAEIDYGQVETWSNDALISADILEEVDPTSGEISINTFDFSVYDAAEEFNMLNPDGIYVALKKKQLLIPRGYLNGTLIPMGKYYLDTWKNTSAVVAKFTAVDIMGVFDTITYKTSLMWSGVAAGTIFAAIFATAGWTDYTIEDDIASELVYGYIPVVTVREALHQLCFALRAACIPNRSGIVEVKRLPSSAAANTIEKSQKMGSQTITQNTLVNSVAVTAYSFASAASTTQLYSVTLAIETHEITFNAPATGLTVTGGTITASGINYAIISVTTAGTVTITGYAYASSTSTYVYEDSTLTDSTRSQATVDSIYLVSDANAAALAQYLYENYQRRIVQKFKLAIEDEKVGDNVDVDTMLNARKTGMITKLDIDLTGGIIADCEVRG